MTVDTETIRQAVNTGGVMAKIHHGQSLDEVFEAALAALGRVEEREAEAAKMLQDAQEMLEEHSWTASSVHRAASILTVVRRARAALDGSVAREECDGSSDCKAATHIHGCFAERPGSVADGSGEE